MSWWVGVPPAAAEAGCGHVVRWEAGACLAPGRRGCECAEHVAAWERHSANPRVLVLGPRRFAERPAPAQERSLHFQPIEHPDDGDGLVPLLQLGGGLPQRLVATVAAALAAGDPRLEAAVYGRAAAALGDWLGRDPPPIAVGEPAAVVRVHGRVRATVPFAWLIRVWARGLAVVGGRFCLDAETGDGRTFTLTVVALDLGPPETLTLTMPG